MLTLLRQKLTVITSADEIAFTQRRFSLQPPHIFNCDNVSIMKRILCNLSTDLGLTQWRAVLFLVREAVVSNKQTDSNQLTKMYLKTKSILRSLAAKLLMIRS
jgi:hypothetical protein